MGKWLVALDPSNRSPDVTDTDFAPPPAAAPVITGVWRRVTETARIAEILMLPASMASLRLVGCG